MSKVVLIYIKLSFFPGGLRPLHPHAMPPPADLEPLNLIYPVRGDRGFNLLRKGKKLVGGWFVKTLPMEENWQ